MIDKNRHIVYNTPYTSLEPKVNYMLGKEKYLIAGAAALALSACGQSEIKRAAARTEAVCGRIENEHMRAYASGVIFDIIENSEEPIPLLKSLKSKCDWSLEREVAMREENKPI
jgi:hypothetical protein